MDIRCPKCGEPWEVDSLHDNERGLSYADAYKLFFAQGCGPVFLTNCDGEGGMAALYASALYDLLGDDVDGIAAELEDAEYLGFLQ